MFEIVNMKKYAGGIDEAIQFYHGTWGSDRNYAFYYDAIIHSTDGNNGLPRFYVLLKHGRIIGCYGLVVNDFISRHDLCPWLAGLYVIEQERGHSLGSRLLQHGEAEAKKAGYSILYLTTDHDGYYEKYGWERIEDGYEHSGNATRIYRKLLTEE